MEKNVVIITGASGGIGNKIVSKFLDNNFHVVMVDVNEQALIKTSEKENYNKDNVTLCPLNITDEESVKITIDNLVKSLGHIDALVNTAGICGEYCQTAEYSFDNFKKIYDVNVFGTFLMIKYSLPVMVRQHKGSIVNFGSVSGMRGYSYEVGYGSSKWAVIGMTKNVANEYGNKGIRVNSVSPGWVNTGMMQKTLDNYRKIGVENPEDWITLGPIERPAEPSEIADAVYFLSSDEARYITGANLLVDGGMLLG